MSGANGVWSMKILVMTSVLFTICHPAAALDRQCDPSFENCRTQLLALIDNEHMGIDVAFWFMEDQRYATHIVNRWNAGVPVRIIVDPRASSTYLLNASMLDQFRQAGIPMRKKSGGGIMHWKTMVFAGQNTVEFGSANFSPNAFVDVADYTNYVGETVYYTDDPAIVNSFKRKFDDLWIDTTRYSDYANVLTRARHYPVYAIDPDLNFPPGQDFASRSVKLYTAETQKIDVTMYRITDRRHSDAMLAAVARGVPVRLITETKEYRNASRLWHAWNVDRMWYGGIQVRVRAHEGLEHAKAVLLYSQGMTIFGSSNWTSASANSQQEHNYFTTRVSIFNWFVDQFERKWHNSNPIGAIETKPLAPLPPDAPVYQSIPDGATGVATTGRTLKWYGGPWAHIYDIYFGTDPSASTLFAANQELGPSQTSTDFRQFALPALQPGTTYYWRIVSKTAAFQTRQGPVWSFTTSGTLSAPPPPDGATTVVMWPATAQGAAYHGNWTSLADSSAAGGSALWNVDHGAAKISSALASPSNYVDMPFSALAGTAYHLWVRLRAQNNSLTNDSVHIQFNDAVDSEGRAIMRIGTSGSAEPVLQNGPADSSDASWGWADNGWGALGTHIYFASTGTHTLRVQQREDGAIVDQIVLSPDKYLTTAPGRRDNDATILPATEPTTDAAAAGGTIAAGDILLHPADATVVVGNWIRTPDSTAATGASLLNADHGEAKITTAAAAPADHFDITFDAAAGVAYRLWLRGKATNNYWGNDSVHVQFSDSTDAVGNALFRIGTTGSTVVNLEDCKGCGLSGWGWQDNGWGTGVMGPLIYFGTSGTHTMRIQPREDGLALDQIVLSPDTYKNQSPGALENDSTVLQ